VVRQWLGVDQFALYIQVCTSKGVLHGCVGLPSCTHELFGLHLFLHVLHASPACLFSALLPAALAGLLPQCLLQ